MSEYNLNDETSYQDWKTAKLVSCPQTVDTIFVSINDPFSLKDAEKTALLTACNQNNYVIYQLLDEKYDDKALVHALGDQLGLRNLDSNLRADEDSVTSLEVREQSGNQYIPYTNKALSWHCDGYYNTLDKQIYAIVMHCVNPAQSGGENQLIDHELMYIKLRDENPAFIEALMQPDAMVIPANIEEGVEIRAEQTGPVFSVDARSGRLHMRYSARKCNIRWKGDELMQQAAAMITECLNDDSIMLQHKLTAGQGIICNNVLHNRARFEDNQSQKRLMYRARYYDRVGANVK